MKSKSMAVRASMLHRGVKWTAVLVTIVHRYTELECLGARAANYVCSYDNGGQDLGRYKFHQSIYLVIL